MNWGWGEAEEADEAGVLMPVDVDVRVCVGCSDGVKRGGQEEKDDELGKRVFAGEQLDEWQLRPGDDSGLAVLGDDDDKEGPRRKDGGCGAV